MSDIMLLATIILVSVALDCILVFIILRQTEIINKQKLKIDKLEGRVTIKTLEHDVKVLRSGEIPI